MTYKDAVEHAKAESRKHARTQHVQHHSELDTYSVSDWYDCDETIASYTNGISHNLKQ